MMVHKPFYLLVGNGRVARHFRHYLELQGLRFGTWDRGEPAQSLNKYLKTASHILVLIRDDAIEDFIKEKLGETSASCVHFSGSLVTPLAFGAHPLMSFGEVLYDLGTYQSIPFILDDAAPDFSRLLPGLPNPYWRLDAALKPKYHALCVLSGNFSCLLWQKLCHSFKQELNLPPEFMVPYLQQITKNLVENPQTALTGPLVRHDVTTIEKNLAALEADPFRLVYESFVSCYEKLKKEQFYEDL